MELTNGKYLRVMLQLMLVLLHCMDWLTLVKLKDTCLRSKKITTGSPWPTRFNLTGTTPYAPFLFFLKKFDLHDFLDLRGKYSTCHSSNIQQTNQNSVLTDFIASA